MKINTVLHLRQLKMFLADIVSELWHLDCGLRYYCHKEQRQKETQNNLRASLSFRPYWPKKIKL